MDRQKEAPVFLQVLGENYAKLAESFASAPYELTPNQLKAWIVFVATLDPDNDDGSNIYRLNAFDIADKLGIDKRKARGTMVADIFADLSTKGIRKRGNADRRGEMNVFAANFVSGVAYDKDSHILQLEIPKMMRPYLFALKEGAYLSLDERDILSLDSIPSIRTFIYLKNLDRQGINTISIDEFRQGVGAITPYYDDFKRLKSKLIIPVSKEIRKHTDYKDFFINDNGGRGRKATLLTFGFFANADLDLFEGVAPAKAAICKRFSPMVQISIKLAMNHGFDPAYIENKLDGIPDDNIIANFHYVEFEIINKDKKKGKDKGPEVYGKYFLKAVQEHWAEQSGKLDEMLGRGKARQKYAKVEEQMAKAQEKEEVANHALFVDEKAKEYLENLYKDAFKLDKFVRENIRSLNAMAGKNEFNMAHAMSKKKNYREYKILVKFITAKMTLREIEFTTQGSLF